MPEGASWPKSPEPTPAWSASRSITIAIIQATWICRSQDARKSPANSRCARFPASVRLARAAHPPEQEAVFAAKPQVLTLPLYTKLYVSRSRGYTAARLAGATLSRSPIGRTHEQRERRDETRILDGLHPDDCGRVARAVLGPNGGRRGV